jgi:NADP-dependent 3-hydroxy acid dehydrogenase YdfG
LAQPAVLWSEVRKSTPILRLKELSMSARSVAVVATQTREERIEALMKELRPKIEATVRQMVQRAVDVPEAQELGAIDFEFRDAGQKLANEVRQASVASRKKRATSHPA